MALAFDGAMTPWAGPPSFDRRLVVTEAGRKPPPGLHRLGPGAREPAIEAVGLAGTPEVRTVPGQRVGRRELRLLCGALGELLCVLRAPGCRPSQHEPCRSSWGEGPV